MTSTGITAVITGANRGLGLEMVRQMCDNTSIQKIYALCRKTSDKLTDLASSQDNKVVVVPEMDVGSDEVAPKLTDYFKDKGSIDWLIHNAGAYGPVEEHADEASMYSGQSLANVTMERMRGALEINTFGPLRVTQALLPNLKTSSEASPKRIIIISSAMGSIADNTSGGHYGYRTAKAGVNMIGKSLANDLKADQIAVGMIHPGFVLTGFDSGKKEDKNASKRHQGQRDVEPSTTGVLQALEKVTMETTGQFWHGNYAEGVKSLPW